ncbi:DUF5677 domain-containing protein [Brevibacillus reuszeri]|uniref:DUF5677 domain-containing protein n=1 Tax=Brevibacillus reuszeri TaxID=54915 RepID=UPI000CCC24CF|nr:DUF5677 domain-containing protein [Brevibacillus reuszeri]
MTVGPFATSAVFQKCNNISHNAREIYKNYITNEVMRELKPTQHLILRMIYNSETTSSSISFMTSWLHIIQALSLLRVRQEQCIVSSYLLNEEPEKGLYPFVAHVSVSKYINMRDALKEDEIKENLEQRYLDELPKLRDEAIYSNQQLNPDFDANSEKFERKWTKLDLLSMCKRRDELAKISGKGFLKLTLQASYVSLYRNASHLIHADCVAVSDIFLSLVPIGPDGQKMLMGKPSWAPTIMLFNTLFDIIQYAETLIWLGFDVCEEYECLFKEWKNVRNEVLED